MRARDGTKKSRNKMRYSPPKQKRLMFWISISYIYSSTIFSKMKGFFNRHAVMAWRQSLRYAAQTYGI